MTWINVRLHRVLKRPWICTKHLQFVTVYENINERFKTYTHKNSVANGWNLGFAYNELQGWFYKYRKYRTWTAQDKKGVWEQNHTDQLCQVDIETENVLYGTTWILFFEKQQDRWILMLTFKIFCVKGFYGDITQIQSNCRTRSVQYYNIKHLSFTPPNTIPSVNQQTTKKTLQIEYVKSLKNRSWFHIISNIHYSI